MILSIWSTLEGWAADFKQFILDNNSNPLLWIGLLGGGLLLCYLVYESLHSRGD